MGEIRFRHPFIERGADDEEWLARRIAGIVCDNPDPSRQENGSEFALDQLNSWKMKFDEITGEYVVTDKYESDAKMEQARLFIIVFLHLKKYND